MSEQSDAAILAALRAAVLKEGSPSAFAAKAGVSPSYVRDVQRGARPVGPKILTALGLQRAVVPISGGANADRD